MSSAPIPSVQGTGPAAPSAVSRGERLRTGEGDLVRGLGEDAHGAGVGEDVPDLDPRGRRVDRHGHRPRGEDGEVQHDPVRGVSTEHRHPVAGPHPVGAQPGRDGADESRHLACGSGR